MNKSFLYLIIILKLENIVQIEWLDKLKLYPASFPQDCAEVSNGRYPIEWNEMLGRIFHRICYKYKDKLINTLPISIFNNYR